MSTTLTATLAALAALGYATEADIEAADTSDSADHGPRAYAAQRAIQAARATDAGEPNDGQDMIGTAGATAVRRWLAMAEHNCSCQSARRACSYQGIGLDAFLFGRG